MSFEETFKFMEIPNVGYFNINLIEAVWASKVL